MAFRPCFTTSLAQQTIFKKSLYYKQKYYIESKIRYIFNDPIYEREIKI
ncbi:hypothetical protein TSL1_06910 [Sulfurovum sp. TSL1]|nr:hypothetical protein TSL1_06910 [Sulfurovum sp. TSL1]